MGQLITAITNLPAMAYPNYSKPLMLHTDASEAGRKVTSYCSWVCSLTAAERNYHLHTSKLEFLALKWATSKQFRDYLYHASHFTVYTDNSLLSHVLTSARLKATCYRWVAELSDYNFAVKYRPGNANRDEMPCQGCLSNNILMDVRKKLSQNGLKPQWNLWTLSAK